MEPGTGPPPPPVGAPTTAVPTTAPTTAPTIPSTASTKPAAVSASAPRTAPTTASATMASEKQGGGYYYWHDSVAQGAPAAAPQRVEPEAFAAVHVTYASIDNYGLLEEDEIIKLYIALDGDLEGLSGDEVEAQCKKDPYGEACSLDVIARGKKQSHRLHAERLMGSIIPEEWYTRPALQRPAAHPRAACRACGSRARTAPSQQVPRLNEEQEAHCHAQEAREDGVGAAARQRRPAVPPRRRRRAALSRRRLGVRPRRTSGPLTEVGLALASRPLIIDAASGFLIHLQR